MCGVNDAGRCVWYMCYMCHVCVVCDVHINGSMCDMNLVCVCYTSGVNVGCVWRLSLCIVCILCVECLCCMGGMCCRCDVSVMEVFCRFGVLWYACTMSVVCGVHVFSWCTRGCGICVVPVCV